MNQEESIEEIIKCPLRCGFLSFEKIEVFNHAKFTCMKRILLGDSAKLCKYNPSELILDMDEHLTGCDGCRKEKYSEFTQEKNRSVENYNYNNNPHKILNDSMEMSVKGNNYPKKFEEDNAEEMNTDYTSKSYLNDTLIANPSRTDNNWKSKYDDTMCYEPKSSSRNFMTKGQSVNNGNNNITSKNRNINYNLNDTMIGDDFYQLNHKKENLVKSKSKVNNNFNLNDTMIEDRSNRKQKQIKNYIDDSLMEIDESISNLPDDNSILENSRGFNYQSFFRITSNELNNNTNKEKDSDFNNEYFLN